LDAGSKRGAPAVLVRPLWRRTSPLYRRWLRLDGRYSRDRDSGAIMAHDSCARASGRVATGGHTATETRNAYDVETKKGSWRKVMLRYWVVANGKPALQ
jgi:hypothetical protein